MGKRIREKVSAQGGEKYTNGLLSTHLIENVKWHYSLKRLCVVVCLPFHSTVTGVDSRAVWRDGHAGEVALMEGNVSRRGEANVCFIKTALARGNASGSRTGLHGYIDKEQMI